MKEFGDWIPQIFYDLIGRVAPGAFLSLVGAGLLVDPESFATLARFVADLPVTVSGSMGLVMSYMVGVILGGLAYLVLDKDLFVDDRTIVADVPMDVRAPIRTNGQTSFMYDALQIYHPAAGARLAKLQAERHMCGVLFAGGVVLLAAGVAGLWRNRAPAQWVVVVGLLGMVLASRAFYLHLGVRAKRLLMNHCRLSNELFNVVQAARPEPQPQVAGPPLPLTVARRLWLLVWWGRRRS